MTTETLSVLRHRRNSGNKTSKNSRQINKWKETNIYIIVSFINEELLQQCHKELDGSKVIGIDSISKEEYAEQSRKQLGEGRLETFDFLGFSFYCSRIRQVKPCIKVKTSKKEFKQKVKAMKLWLYENRDIRAKSLMEKLRIKFVWHHRSHNSTEIGSFRHRILEYLFKVLNRRSNKRATVWKVSIKC